MEEQALEYAQVSINYPRMDSPITYDDRRMSMMLSVKGTRSATVDGRPRDIVATPREVTSKHKSFKNFGYGFGNIFSNIPTSDERPKSVSSDITAVQMEAQQQQQQQQQSPQLDEDLQGRDSPTEFANSARSRFASVMLGELDKPRMSDDPDVEQVDSEGDEDWEISPQVNISSPEENKNPVAVSMSTNTGKDLMTFCKIKDDVYTKVNKIKQFDQALAALDSLNTVDYRICQELLPDSFVSERAEFEKNTRSAELGNVKGKSDADNQMIKRVVKTVVEIWEVSRILKNFDAIVANGPDKKNAKKMLKMLKNADKNLRKFHKKLVLRANAAPVYEDAYKWRIIERCFIDVDELLASNHKFNKDKIWYIDALRTAFILIDEIDDALNLSLNLHYTQHVPLDEDTLKFAQKEIQNELGNHKKEIESLKKKMRAKYSKLAFERACFAAEYGLSELYARIYFMLSSCIYTREIVESEQKMIDEIYGRKCKWDKKRSEALEELQEKDKILLEKILEAAEKMRPLYIQQAEAQKKSQAEYTFSYEEIVNSNTMEVDKSHKGKSFEFKNVKLSCLSTVFKEQEAVFVDPANNNNSENKRESINVTTSINSNISSNNGDDFDEACVWDANVSQKYIRFDADWKEALTAFVKLEKKVLKKHGVPEVAHVSYGYCSTGDDELIRYHQHRVRLSPLPLHLIGIRAHTESRVIAALGEINGVTINPLTTDVRRTLALPGSQESSDLSFNVPVEELWPCVAVTVQAIHQDFAVWANGKCSLQNVNFQSVFPK